MTLFFQVRLMTPVGINPHGHISADLMGLLMCFSGRPVPCSFPEGGTCCQETVAGAHPMSQLSQMALRPSSLAPPPRHTPRGTVSPQASAESVA